MSGSDQALGLHGGVVIDDTDAHTGSWCAVQVVVAATLVDESCVCNLTDLDGLDGVELTVGTVLYGHWTTIQLVSGTVIAYKRQA